MARLASQAKMGYYPTPSETLGYITTKLEPLHGREVVTVLDPCCGRGEALSKIVNALGYYSASSYGIELDTERARIAHSHSYIERVLPGSIYDAVIRPAGSFSLLYLNPPYDFEKGERMEFLFLRRSHNWLTDGGLLIFLVPEHILGVEKISKWIARRYTYIRVYRFTREDYPVFKQVVLFGMKKKEDEGFSEMPLSYPHIEDTQGDATYSIPFVQCPKAFELEGMTEEEIAARREESIGDVKNALVGPEETNSKILSPIFPLRKGHLLSILMSGVLNGKLSEDMYFKCYTQRCKAVREEEVDAGEKSKIITTDSYQSGIRVIERGNWYDVA